MTDEISANPFLIALQRSLKMNFLRDRSLLQVTDHSGANQNAQHK
jgi:hypothetical protein